MRTRDRTRREFPAEVGKGMLIASVGACLAADLGVSLSRAAEAPSKTPPDLDKLVELLQQTEMNKLLPALVEKLQGGAELKSLVAACALANARRFGGTDYDGYHAFMALAPSFE